MSTLNPVLYGNRLFGRETYSENADPQTFNLNFSESLASTDALADQLTKVLSDSTTLLDAYAATLMLVKTDTITLSDAKAIVATKSLSDSLSSADSKAITTSKVLLDMLTSSDTITFDNTKRLSESMTLSEAFMISFGKSFAEMLTLVDSRALTIVKPLSEGPLSSPVLYGQNLFGRTTYSNSSNPTNPPVMVLDALAISFIKRLSETLTLTDQQQHIIQKRIFDSISSVDPRILTTLTKALSETVLVQDWLSIQIQQPTIWVLPSTIIPYSTLYGQNLFGRKLYSGLSGQLWITTPTAVTGNGWINFNEMRNA